jgi:sugar phosphate isomerase/epimerase
MGLCMDIGHTARTGADIVKSLADAGPRLLDMHVKDLLDPKGKDSQCDVGDGRLPIVAIFKQLKKMGYKGCVNLEYEINAKDPLGGMKESFAYMRGVVAGLSSSKATS